MRLAAQMSLPDPIFILAPVHGFAPWLNAMLGLHPQLQSLPGIPLLAEGLVSFPRRPELHSALFRTVAQLRWGRQDEMVVRQARDWLAGQPARDGVSLRLALADWAVPDRLVERSPCYLNPAVLHRIQRTFPNACYLHLVCHPRTQLQNVRRWQARKGGVSPVIDPVRSWLTPVLAALEFLQTQAWNRRLMLRAEDLLQEPARYLVQLTEWLGLANDSRTIQAMLHPERWPFAAEGLDWALFSDDREFLSSPKLPAGRAWPDESETGIANISDEVYHYTRLLGYT